MSLSQSQNIQSTPIRIVPFLGGKPLIGCLTRADREGADSSLVHIGCIYEKKNTYCVVLNYAMHYEQLVTVSNSAILYLTVVNYKGTARTQSPREGSVLLLRRSCACQLLVS